MEAHGEDLRAAGASESVVRAFKRQPRRVRLDARAGALRDFALKLTLHPGAMREADVETLRGAGLSDGDILDAVQIIAYFNSINRVAEGLGVDPEPGWPRRPAWIRNIPGRRRVTLGAGNRVHRRPRRGTQPRRD